MEGTGMPYTLIKTTDGHTNGGIRAAAEEEPTYWLSYFGTNDIDASIAKVKDLGGDALMGPVDIGVGNIAVVRDLQGAVFALYSGNFAD
jgi:predicted enzyme related to lactoylglutathione lyase